ncbi:HK97 gp10 family phage protein [Photobacterium swingsii]|uniref:HK97 gp10 family phage protein n=1 Tax=Photobacterium swingsii TaxID=680026 RepID=UPI00352BE8AE
MIKVNVGFNGEFGINGIDKEISKSLQYFDPKPSFRKGKKAYRSNPLQNDIRAELKIAAETLADKARSNAPVITPDNLKKENFRTKGIHLKDHIKVRMAGNKSVNKYNDGIVSKGRVTTTKEVSQYATVVEFGRDANVLDGIGLMNPVPYMSNAVLQVGESAVKNFYRGFEKRFEKRAKQLERKVNAKVRRYKK